LTGYLIDEMMMLIGFMVLKACYTSLREIFFYILPILCSESGKS